MNINNTKLNFANFYFWLTLSLFLSSIFRSRIISNLTRFICANVEPMFVFCFFITMPLIFFSVHTFKNRLVSLSPSKHSLLIHLFEDDL